MGGLTGKQCIAVSVPKVAPHCRTDPESRPFRHSLLDVYVHKGHARAIKYYPFLYMSAIIFHFGDN